MSKIDHSLLNPNNTDAHWPTYIPESEEAKAAAALDAVEPVEGLTLRECRFCCPVELWLEADRISRGA